VGEWVLHNYAPADKHVAFHFEKYDKNIFTPVIRSAIRGCKVVVMDHYTVYLPAYDDRKLAPLLSKIPVKWHVFSKHTRKGYTSGNVAVYPVNSEDFAASMTSSKGVLCGAGFETPAEALFLKKKLMVVPMQSQLEQFYNAASLRQMGVPVLKKFRKKNLDRIREWVDSNEQIVVNFDDITAEAVSLAVKLARK
jgi:uncharacterized protein (TIGR00661 family)